MCEESDIQSVFTDLSLANSILSGTCQIQTPQVPIIPTGEETLLTGELACFFYVVCGYFLNKLFKDNLFGIAS